MSVRNHKFEKRFLQTEDNLMLPIAESAMRGRRPIVFVTTPMPAYMKKSKGSKSALSINKKVLIYKDALAPYLNAEGIARHPSFKQYNFRSGL